MPSKVCQSGKHPQRGRVVFLLWRIEGYPTTRFSYSAPLEWRVPAGDRCRRGPQFRHPVPSLAINFPLVFTCVSRSRVGAWFFSMEASSSSSWMVGKSRKEKLQRRCTGLGCPNPPTSMERFFRSWFFGGAHLLLLVLGEEGSAGVEGPREVAGVGQRSHCPEAGGGDAEMHAGAA